MRWRASATVLGIVVGIAMLLVSAGAGAATPRARSAARCRSLHASKRLRSKLLHVHRAQLRRTNRHLRRRDRMHARGPFGRVHYGRCGHRRYALATFHQRTRRFDFGAQDQPERFTRRRHRRWRDRGDTGGDVCGVGIPRALIRRWHLAERCH